MIVLVSALVAVAGLSGCAGRRAPVAVERPAPRVSAEPLAVSAGRRFVVATNDPDASDANPGTAGRPWKTLGRAARRGVLQPGDVVTIREGVYRESLRPASGGTGPDARVTFEAAPGERVVVSGADVWADGWVHQPDGAWRHAWSGPSLPSYSDDPTFRRELVVAAGRVLRPVARRQDLRPGTFFVEGPDVAPQAVVVLFPDRRTPAEAAPVEVAVRTELFSPLGPNPYAECGDAATPGWFRVSGITFRHAANRAQWGAVCAGSRGSLFEDVTVAWTNGMGLSISGRSHTFRRVRAEANGQMGWGGSCAGCRLDETAAVGNNWKGHDPFWEAGGSKFTRTTDTVIRRHYAAHNGGPGLWLDIDNHRNVIEGALVVDNVGAGILLELATTETLVQHNVVAATRWRDWTGTGLLSQAASRNVIAHNTLVANEGTGLWLRLDPARRAPDGATVVTGNRIVGNAARRDVEAREIAVEAASVADLRTNRLSFNVYGPVGGDGVLRSAFFAHPTREGDYRGDRLAAWEHATGDTGSVVRAGPSLRLPERAAARAWPGGPAPALSPTAGADLTRVRAYGDWKEAPSGPPWPP